MALEELTQTKTANWTKFSRKELFLNQFLKRTFQLQKNQRQKERLILKENKLFSIYKAIFLFLSLVFSALIFAQEQERPGDFSANFEDSSVQEEETELSALEQWQYLDWDEENPEYVFHYEVVIESFSEKTSTFEEINRIMTEDNSSKVQVNPLLPPGVYRYKVISYNLVDVPEVESNWFEFKIYKAYQPEITDIKSAANRTGTLFLE